MAVEPKNNLKLEAVLVEQSDTNIPPKKNLIRIKSDKFVNSESNNNKNEQYVAVSSIKLLKIDFRLLINAGNDGVDGVAGKCALNDANGKAIEDERKLMRQTKYALSEVLKSVPDDLNEFQGLCVNMHRHALNIPSSCSLLENVGSKIACTSFNRRQALSLNPKLCYILDTYYTPPRYHKSKLPVFIAFSNATALAPESAATSSKSPIPPPSTTRAIIMGEPDKFGYIDKGSGTYYNIHTKKYYDYHPHVEAKYIGEEND